MKNKFFSMGGAFASLTGAPGDNAALAAALAAKLDTAGGTLTGALVNSTNGAASTPVLSLTGSVFTGGTATSTKPSLLLEPTGATSNNWSTSGTFFGVNAASGFAGNLFDAQVNGSRRFCVTSTGALLFGSSSTTGTVLSITTNQGTIAASMVGGADLWWDKGMIVPATGVVRWGFSGSNDPILTGGTGTLTLTQATLVTPASSSTRAGFRIVAGTAPSSPTNGDIWQDGTDIKIRIGGVTKTFTLV
jgi:hypothetical protein